MSLALNCMHRQSLDVAQPNTIANTACGTRTGTMQCVRTMYNGNRLTVSVGDRAGEDAVLEQCLHIPLGRSLCMTLVL